MREETEREYTKALFDAAKKLREVKANEKLIGKLHEIAGYLSAQAEHDKERHREEMERIKAGH